MSKTRAKLSAVETAMSQPDTAIDGFAITQPYSFTGQIAALKVGESASRVTPIDPGLRLAELPEYLPGARARLRNNVTPSVRQAVNKTGASYSVEVTDLQTLAGHGYIVAIVTRVK